jgi:hypothetical protein
MSYLKDKYNSVIRKNLQAKFGFKNEMEIPKLEKVCLNIAFKTADGDGTFLKYVVDQLTAIAGQKAVLVKAKKSSVIFVTKFWLVEFCQVQKTFSSSITKVLSARSVLCLYSVLTSKIKRQSFSKNNATLEIAFLKLS